MQVHLVDATYELFRAHFSPRPPVRGRDGLVLSGVSGLVEQLCYLVREQGATHVGCATDRVVRSFRNDLYPGYKSEVGMDPAVLAQFPIAEAAIEALGFVLWPMVEFEADDAIAAAAERFAADERVERVLICSADKDLAQCVRAGRVVLWDRRRDLVYDDAGVRAKWGVPPTSVPDRLALVGDASDGFPGLPGWGDRSASAALARYGHLEDIPPNGGEWDVTGLRNAAGLAATLRERMAEALLYRDLARLRTSADGVPIPQADVDELAWPGADRDHWEAFCDEWGLPRLRARPPRWREDRRHEDPRHGDRTPPGEPWAGDEA
jgi:5'-3' exonuclease